MEILQNVSILVLFLILVLTNIAWYWYAGAQTRSIDANWNLIQSKTRALTICFERNINPCVASDIEPAHQ